MAWDFGASPRVATDAPEEVIESYEFANIGSGDESVTRIRCARTEELWERMDGDYTEQYGSSWFLHIFPNVGFFSLKAEPQGTEVVAGRPAYELVDVEDLGPDKGTERRYWLDKEPLWPLQWELESDGHIIRGIVEDVNGEVEIRPLSEGGGCAQ